MLEVNEKEFEAFMSAIVAYYKYVGSIEPLTRCYEDNRTAKQG